jgi:hypothetical protein
MRPPRHSPHRCNTHRDRDSRHRPRCIAGFHPNPLNHDARLDSILTRRYRLPGNTHRHNIRRPMRSNPRHRQRSPRDSNVNRLMNRGNDRNSRWSRSTLCRDHSNRPRMVPCHRDSIRPGDRSPGSTRRHNRFTDRAVIPRAGVRPVGTTWWTRWGWNRGLDPDVRLSACLRHPATTVAPAAAAELQSKDRREWCTARVLAQPSNRCPSIAMAPMLRRRFRQMLNARNGRPNAPDDFHPIA